MKKAIVFYTISASLFLSGCISLTDQEVGQVVILVTPTVFIFSLGFQYLFFRLWKIKFPELTLSWYPNFIFFIFLLVIAGLFGNGNLFWFLTDELEFRGLILIVFGSSFLTVLFVIMRVGLYFYPSKVFTWASIAVMSFYILSALPMIAGITEGTSYVQYIRFFWTLPGTVLFLSSNYGWPGSLTAIVFMILLMEVLIVIGLRRYTVNE